MTHLEGGKFIYAETGKPCAVAETLYHSIADKGSRLRIEAVEKQATPGYSLMAIAL